MDFHSLLLSSYNSLHFSEKAFHKIFGVSPLKTAFVRFDTDTDVGGVDLAHHLCSSSFQTCSVQYGGSQGFVKAAQVPPQQIDCTMSYETGFYE